MFDADAYFAACSKKALTRQADDSDLPCSAAQAFGFTQAQRGRETEPLMPQRTCWCSSPQTTSLGLLPEHTKALASSVLHVGFARFRIRRTAELNNS
jgi:hypothetical protein